MSDLEDVYFTPEARSEIRDLQGEQQARVKEKVRHLQRIGWAQALQLELVKPLKDKHRAHEIRVKGKGPAFRLLCYPLGGKQGRIVVTTTCSAKGSLLGRGLKRELARSKNRLDKWVSQHGGLLR